MKTIPIPCLAALGAALVVILPRCAQADATADAQLSFINLSITPGAGTFDLLTNWAGAAYGQATVASQYDTGATPSVFVTGDYSTASGSASAASPSAQSGADASVTGAAADNASGQAWVESAFMITGGTGDVSTVFSAQLIGSLNVLTDAAGQLAQAEAVFSLELNGDPVLFNDQLLSIGASDSQNLPLSSPLNNTVTLQYNTPYIIYIETDSEVSVSSVPEPRAAGLLAIGLSLGLWAAAKRRGERPRPGRPADAPFETRRTESRRSARGIIPAAGRNGIAALLLVFSLGGVARATYVGADAPDVCLTCGAQATRQDGGTVATSLTEGNLREDYPVTTLRSAAGPTLQLSLVYNSYSADGSKAELDTGVGIGWTHTYNQFLFNQRGSFFLMGPDGRVTLFRFGFGGNYTTDNGYFETLSSLPDGSLVVSNKFHSWWKFALVPNTHLLVSGMVYRLIQMGDRKGNLTTMFYSSGLLTLIQDAYGRNVTLTYTNQHLWTITDPLGHTTTLQYDSRIRSPIRITDPNGNVTRYTYNANYQITRKTDRDGRVNSFLYRNLKPWAIMDGNGQVWFALQNPNNWAVDRTALAEYMRRVYIPATVTNLDGNGNAWRYQYDTNGYITRTTAPDGATTSYSYDPLLRTLAAVTNADGAVTRFQYDAHGNRTNLTDALGNVTTYTYDPVFNELASRTDPNGRVTVYQYDAEGNRTNEIDPLLQIQTWAYDAHGNVLTQTDQNGHTTTYQYDAHGDCTNLTDALGHVTTYEYDAAGNRVETIDPLGRTTTYGYDGLNRLIAQTNSLDGVTAYTYDGDGRTTSVTDPNGNTTSYAYDARGRLMTTVDPLGGAVTCGYDDNNNQIAATNQLGNITTYGYDTQNRRVEDVDALGHITTYRYDPAGNVTTNLDANGHATTYAYDPLNRKITMTDADGNETFYDYSTPGGPPCCSPTIGSGLVTRQQDANGHVTFYDYDELDRLTQIVKKQGGTNDTITPSDAVTTYTYDPVGNRLSATDPVGNTTTYGYDALNRNIASTNAAGDVSTTVYDAVGNVLSHTAPNQNITVYTYDGLNRTLSAYDEDGLLTTNTYDADGNRLSVADANGHTTTYGYDPLNRVVTTTDPLGQSSYTLYDSVGNVLTNIDRNGYLTSYQYDPVNRQTAQYDALGNTTSYAYDAVGNVTNVTDANGHVTTYTYDPVNRRIAETYAGTPPNTISYTYDAVGNMLSRTDQKGQVTTYAYSELYFVTNRNYFPSGNNDTFTYDLAGRTLAANRGGWVETFGYDGANRLVYTTQNGELITYSYDLPARLETNTYPSGRIIRQTTDGRGRLLSAQEGASPPIVTYAYDGANRVLDRTNGNGTVTMYTYDADNRVSFLATSNSAGFILGFDYSYDHEGNRLTEGKLDDAANSQACVYDPLNRLTDYRVGSLLGNTVPAPALERSWNLDPLGNWNSVTNNAITEYRTHGPANELLTVGTNTYTYDDNGNLAGDAQYFYTYDEENRLVEVQRRSDLAIVGRYFYDAYGRRVIAINNPGGLATTNVYYYDRSRLIEEQNAGGLPQATYVYGNYVDEVLTMERGGQTFYYHQNAHWSPHALTDSSGNVVERYSYDAYGQVTVMDGGYTPLPLNPWGTPHSAAGNPYLFTGRELDEETGLYYYRARHYDAAKGRYLQRDLLGYVDGFNLYEYVGDNPATQLDPSGLVWAWTQHDGSNGNLAWRRDKVNDYVVRYLGLFMPRYGYLDSRANIAATDNSVYAEAKADFHKPDSTLGLYYEYVKYSADRQFSTAFRCDPQNGAITRTKLTLDGDRTDGPLTVDVGYSASIDNSGAKEHTVQVDVTVIINVGGTVTVSSTVNLGAEAGGEAGGDGGKVNGKINVGASFSRSLTYSGGKDRGPLVRGFTLRCQCGK